MLGYWFQPALQIVLVADLAWSGIDGISMALTKLQLVQLAVNFSIVVLLGRPWEPDQSVTAIDSRCPYHGQSSLGMAWNILWVWNRPSMIVKTKICTWLQDVTSIKKKLHCVWGLIVIQWCSAYIRIQKRNTWATRQPCGSKLNDIHLGAAHAMSQTWNKSFAMRLLQRRKSLTSTCGGFHKWGYPKMDGLDHGKSHSNGGFGE